MPTKIRKNNNSSNLKIPKPKIASASQNVLETETLDHRLSEKAAYMVTDPKCPPPQKMTLKEDSGYWKI